MQRLGRAAAAVLQAHRCLTAEATARLQAAPLQQEFAAILDSRMLASAQHSKLGSWPCQTGRQFATSSSSSRSSGGSPLPLCTASSSSSALPWRQLPQLAQPRAFSSTGLFTEQPSLPPATADPAAPDAQQQQQQQQQAPAAGPITGRCRRRNVKCGWKKLDSVLRMIRKSYVDDAMAQLQAHPKRAAVYVQHALANARNNAICAGGQAARLWVSEAFVTKGKHEKRLAIMGRGYSSIKQTRFSHLNVTVTQLEEGQAVAAKLRQRPRAVAPLMVRLQQGQRGRQQQWRRRQLQPPQQQQRSQVAAA